MKCKYCLSSDLLAVQSYPHVKLICRDCCKFQKFLSKNDLKHFITVHGEKSYKPQTEPVIQG